MRQRIFSEADLPQLRLDKQALGSNRAVAAKYGVAESTVLYALNPKARAKGAATALHYARSHKASNKAKTRKYREQHFERTLWSAAKYRARKEQLPFDIDEADIVIPQLCPVLGIPLLRQHGVHNDNSPSMDKIKPALGYVKGNVCVVSHLANRIKSNETNPAVFEAIAAYLTIRSNT